MAAFEGFWDSNCPKIGSAAACGWKNWNEQTNPATEESSSGNGISQILQYINPIIKTIRCEIKFKKKSKLPKTG